MHKHVDICVIEADQLNDHHFHFAVTPDSYSIYYTRFNLTCEEQSAKSERLQFNQVHKFLVSQMEDRCPAGLWLSEICHRAFLA